MKNKPQSWWKFFAGLFTGWKVREWSASDRDLTAATRPPGVPIVNEREGEGEWKGVILTRSLPDPK